MKRAIPIVLLSLLAVDACGNENITASQTRSFTVTIQNVSQPGLLATDRAMGTVPLSPGAWAVFSGSDPAFTVGGNADEGTERIAEDGFPGPPLPLGSKTTLLAAAAGVRSSGAFQSPGGPDNGPALLAGETATFTIHALPGDRLQLETMFVQSNDWFFGFGGGGLALFNGNTPISGDVTSQLMVYDAGTEQDTAPGTGEFQKPVQAPTATNVGPSENVPIRSARERYPNFNIPANASVIRVTIAANVSGD